MSDKFEKGWILQIMIQNQPWTTFRNERLRPWHSQSPVLNITEYLLLYLKGTVHKKWSMNISELETFCRENVEEKKKKLWCIKGEVADKKPTRLRFVWRIQKSPCRGSIHFFSLKKKNLQNQQLLKGNQTIFWAAVYLHSYNVSFHCMPSFLSLLLMCTQCIVHQWIYSK